VMERSHMLLHKEGAISMIVPMSGHSTERMAPLVEHFYNMLESVHVINISADANPSVLFPGVKFRLAVFCGLRKGENQRTNVTRYIRFYAEERDALFDRTYFTPMAQKILGVLP